MEAEIGSVILHFAGGKEQGHDGISGEFYKTYKVLLVPLAIYEKALAKGTFQQSTRKALVLLLLKLGKSADKCWAYRPLSMINFDCKILANVLASRLLPLWPLLILPNQTRFIPGRTISNHPQGVFMALPQVNPGTDADLGTPDAKKAFDRVSSLGSYCTCWARQFVYQSSTITLLQTNGQAKYHGPGFQ